MKLAWATDIHLDCVDNAYEKVKNLAKAGSSCDCFIITGDLSVSNVLIDHLYTLEEVLQKPFYFVLGNHDYYFSDIISTRKKVANACRTMSFARYLATIPYVRIHPNVALVGHDGWYDALNGDFRNNDILMNDWIKISDFSTAIHSSSGNKILDKGAIVSVSRAICQASVNHIASGIRAAVRDKNSHIIVATHVPPFKESYTGNKHGGMDSTSILPWYTSKTMGDTLMAAAKAFPQTKFTILSGHSHSYYNNDLLNNLNVRVGNSQYGSPQIAGIIDI
jgi:predicted phosphohydrolase